MTRALDTLARLRRLETEQARRALGLATAQETQAATILGQAQSAPNREARSTPSDPADPLARAFAAWLPAAASAIADARAACAERQAERDRAQAALAGARASLEAVETLIGERDRLARRLFARRAQLRLDELGHRLG